MHVWEQLYPYLPFGHFEPHKSPLNEKLESSIIERYVLFINFRIFSSHVKLIQSKWGSTGPACYTTKGFHY